MSKKILVTVAMALTSAAMIYAQDRKPVTNTDKLTFVSGEQIDDVVNHFPGDHEIKIADLGPLNIGISVLKRGATKPGAKISLIKHDYVSECYYVVSGEGT